MDYKHNRLYGEVFQQLYGVTYTPKVGEIIEQISQLANVGQYSHVNKTLEEDTLNDLTEPQKWIVDLAKSIETRHRDIVLNYLQVPAIATATKEEIKTVTVYFDFRGLMLTVLQDFDSKHKEAGEIVNCIFLGYKPPTDFKEITTTFQVRGGGRKFPMCEKGANDYDGMSVEDYLEIFNLYDSVHTTEIINQTKKRFKDIPLETLDIFKKILVKITNCEYTRFDMDIAVLSDESFKDVVGQSLHGDICERVRLCMLRDRKPAYLKLMLNTLTPIDLQLCVDLEACLQTSGNTAYLISQTPYGSAPGEAVILIGFDHDVFPTKKQVETPTINTTPQETTYKPYGPGDIPMLLGNHVSILVQSINEVMYNTLDSFTFGPNGEVKFYTLLNKEGDLPPQVIKALEEIFIKEGWDDAKYSSDCDEGRSTPTKSFTVTMKGKPSE